jgi:hypothetical protein
VLTEMVFAPVKPDTRTGVDADRVVLFPSWPVWLSPQHLAVPSWSTAQLCCSPDAIDTTLLRDETGTGVVEFVVSPVPSSPCALLPQHSTLPSLNSAQLVDLAAVTPIAPESTEESEPSLAVPPPPYEVSPQHCKVPADSKRAQLCPSPTARAVAPVSPMTSTGA